MSALTNAQYRALAAKMLVDHDLVVDSDAAIEERDDFGAWVNVWLWVSRNEEDDDAGSD